MRKQAKKYFIPNEGNEYKPHFLRTKMVVALLLFVGLIQLSSVVTVSVLKHTDFLASVLPGVLTTLTNEARVEEKLGVLTTNELLTKAAQLKAEDMAAKGYFAHTSPEGVAPWHWLNEAGYPFEAAGENLAVNFYDSKIVHDAWMNSPAHRENILKGKYTEIGIGMAWGEYKGKDALFVVQFFGKPQAAQVAGLEEPTPEVVDNGEEVTEITIAPEEPEVLGEEISITEEETFIEISMPEETAVAPVEEETPAGVEEKGPSAFEKTASMPTSLAVYVLTALGALVGLALILKIFIAPKIQYMGLIANGLILLACILLLLWLNYHFALLDAVIQ